MLARLYRYLTISLLILVVFSCGDKDSASTGILSVTLTDAPFPTDLVDQANVTIDRVQIKQQGEEEDNFITLSEDVVSTNLLDLSNGVTLNLVNAEVPAGFYSEVRLRVIESEVILKDGTIYDLKIPSGSTSGLKIKIDPSIEVEGGLSSELLLDFDVSKSFVVQGNPNTPAGIKGFIFKPVVRATNVSTAGTLTGLVTDTDGNPIEGATVTLSQNSEDITSVLTDATGTYTALGLPAGTYSVMFEFGELTPVTVDGVEIVAGNSTSQDASFP